jgi:hypothetical protein
MNRIFFKGNPYPNGHQIEEFVWSGRLEKDRGLIFDFHLLSADYYAEDNSEEEEDDDKPSWESKIVWGNYHQCTMSSTYWNDKGVVVGSSALKLDFNNLLNKILIIDPVQPREEYDAEEFVFSIYLLGHDACANHKIAFIKKHDQSTFDMEWKGNIALVYSGGDEFDYSFEAMITKVKFAGISLDQNLSKEANKELLKKCVVDVSAFEIVDNKFQLK